MVYNSSDTSYSANLSTSTTNDSTWTGATNSTISSSSSFNISADVFYPSVIPVSAGNISLMVVFSSDETYLLAQNYADYDVDTDLWDYPLPAQFPLPATSYLDAPDLMYHSEVGWSGNVSNVDDVYAICTANDSVLGKYLWYDRYNNPASPWADDTSLDEGYYIGALGIRNALGDLTMTALENTQKRDIYNDDYTQATQNWDGIVAIAGVDATSDDGIESDYDNANSDYLGVLYYDNTVAFIPDMEFGCYGCPPAAGTVPASVTLMAWIIILVFGALICIILIGYGAYESSRGRSSELAKIGAAGLIGLVIAAIIIEYML